MELFTPVTVNNQVVKNRVVFPPIVNFGWSDTEGMVSQRHINHYEARAKGGAGLIIVEASCVQQDGKIFSYQLGIWDDKHIEGLSKITNACHKYGSKILIQLHHAGLLTRKAVSKVAWGPSADADNERSKAMSLEQVKVLTKNFILAAKRAYQAGFDGIELHGAHGYLLNQFTNEAINCRTDEYGGSFENRLRLPIEIIKGIKAEVPSNFIIDYRMAGCTPTLSEGIEMAKLLEQSGVNLLHVSHGGSKGINPEVPSGFGFNSIVYMGTEVKKHVRVPVIVVNQIKLPEDANSLIKNGQADMVAIGRDQLTDAEWAIKAQQGEDIIHCINCEPRCKRFTKPESCPLYNEL
ncbi:MAG: NADH:flavin oxidoreductase [Bacteroidales bacterium]|nr:NADH:flavin oxidoreductase [Bacteroidales bacterium]